MTAPVRQAPITAADLEVYQRAAVLATYPETAFRRGIADPPLLDTFTGRGIVNTRTGGLGQELQYLMTRPIFTVRTVTPQLATYDEGEAFAYHVWHCMLDAALDRPIMVGSVWAQCVRPAGGEPAEILIDAARRRHWSCSYVIPVASGL
jgi:hypothetical protein